MGVEPISPPLVAKKLWNVMRIVFHMMRKGISKSKLMLDLHMLLKRGRIAIGNLLLDHHHHHYYYALTCRSKDISMSFVTPREYEFSCSNTPVYHSKKKNRHQRRHNCVEEINVVQRMLDILNHYDAVEVSPLTMLPGFGVSPVVRQLRVTDSPFSLKDTDENNHQVDKDAEEFIKKFYKGLKKEKRIAALDTPSPYYVKI
ncbi:Hypothetical predicted protein [Olea europaea subsp. europaea]|uniref:Uncharacterized protein n=1 Tax=Olea europaea subsp. europaea TaxID=158383 RepID=A0A8S0SDL6_OLEEU|nr:Hypothetical predicted protein [Olea europaea subsp. europaea]